MRDDPTRPGYRGLSPAPPFQRHGYASTSAVQGRSVLDRDAVKTALGITGSSLDDQIDELLSEAKVEADSYLGNPFLERDAETGRYVEPNVEIPIPRLVERGVVAYVALGLWSDTSFRLAAEAVLRGDLDAVAPGERLVSVKTGDLSETYALAGGGLAPGKAATDPIEALEARFWSRYRYEPV